MREKTNGKTMSKPFHWIKGDPWIPEWRDDMRDGTQDKHVTFALDPDQIIPKPKNRHIFPKVKKSFWVLTAINTLFEIFIFCLKIQL